MKKIRFWFAGCLLAVPLVLAVWGFLLPAQYRETFPGELAVKCELLAQDAEKPRLVLVGGSAAAFGVDSALLEEQLPQYKVVNFGLYAALGTRVMLDLSEPLLREGDLVVVLPEQQQQTLSDHLGAQTLWQAAEGEFSLLRCLHFRDAAAMLGAFPQFAAQKFRFFCTGGPSLSGVYQRSSFNAAGDIVSPLCTANRMPGGWDPTTPIRFDTALLDKTFCAELNAYAARLAERGVTVSLSAHECRGSGAGAGCGRLCRRVAGCVDPVSGGGSAYLHSGKRLVLRYELPPERQRQDCVHPAARAGSQGDAGGQQSHRDPAAGDAAGRGNCRRVVRDGERRCGLLCL